MAAIVDELVAHATLEGDEVHHISGLAASAEFDVSGPRRMRIQTVALIRPHQ